MRRSHRPILLAHLQPGQVRRRASALSPGHSSDFWRSAMFDTHIVGRFVAPCLGLALASVLIAGCVGDGVTVPEGAAGDAGQPGLAAVSSTVSSEQVDSHVRVQLAELRQATARYHDTLRAMADGWSVRFPEPCLTHSDFGGMGFHLFNPGLADGEVDVTEPELLVYEPRRDGKLQLVGAEYVVPFSVRPETASPPVLFGHEFHHVEAFGVWGLHVWAWQNNPDGVFADWNPRVSCEHADDVRDFAEE